MNRRGFLGKLAALVPAWLWPKRAKATETPKAFVWPSGAARWRGFAMNSVPIFTDDGRFLLRVETSGTVAMRPGSSARETGEAVYALARRHGVRKGFARKETWYSISRSPSGDWLGRYRLIDVEV